MNPGIDNHDSGNESGANFIPKPSTRKDKLVKKIKENKFLLIKIAIIGLAVIALGIIIIRISFPTSHAGNSNSYMAHYIEANTGGEQYADVYACKKETVSSAFGNLYPVVVAATSNSKTLNYLSYAVYRGDNTNKDPDDAKMSYLDSSGKSQTNYFTPLPLSYQSFNIGGTKYVSFYASANLNDEFYVNVSDFPIKSFGLAPFTGQQGGAEMTTQNDVAYNDGLINPSELPSCNDSDLPIKSVADNTPVFTGYSSSKYDVKDEQLSFNQTIAKNGTFSLVMQPDGNLVEYNIFTPIWSTGSSGLYGSYASLKPNGNFVLYSFNGFKLWETKTSGNPDDYLTITNEGYINIEKNVPGGVSVLFTTEPKNLQDGVKAPSSSNANRVWKGGQTVLKNGPFSLYMQNDGNLVVDYIFKPIWSTQTGGNPGAYASMNSSGDFFIWNKDSTKLLWSTATSGHPNDIMYLLSNGTFVIHASDSLTSQQLYSTFSVPTAYRIGNDVQFAPDQTILSNGGYSLRMQLDGNLVEFNGASPVWSTNTSGNDGAYAELQTDGNLVVKNSAGTPIWSTTTSNQGVVLLNMDNQGRIQMFNSSSYQIWPYVPPVIVTTYIPAPPSINPPTFYCLQFNTAAQCRRAIHDRPFVAWGTTASGSYTTTVTSGGYNSSIKNAIQNLSDSSSGMLAVVSPSDITYALYKELDSGPRGVLAYGTEAIAGEVGGRYAEDVATGASLGGLALDTVACAGGIGATVATDGAAAPLGVEAIGSCLSSIVGVCSYASDVYGSVASFLSIEYPIQTLRTEPQVASL